MDFGLYTPTSQTDSQDRTEQSDSTGRTVLQTDRPKTSVAPVFGYFFHGGSASQAHAVLCRRFVVYVYLLSSICYYARCGGNYDDARGI